MSRLDGKEDEIRHFLRLGVSKNAIAKITGVSRADPLSLHRLEESYGPIIELHSHSLARAPETSRKEFLMMQVAPPLLLVLSLICTMRLWWWRLLHDCVCDTYGTAAPGNMQPPEELPELPLLLPTHAVQAPIVDPLVEPDGNLHVGADAAPPDAALTSMETHTGVPISSGPDTGWRRGCPSPGIFGNARLGRAIPGRGGVHV